MGSFTWLEDIIYLYDTVISKLCLRKYRGRLNWIDGASYIKDSNDAVYMDSCNFGITIG